MTTATDPSLGASPQRDQVLSMLRDFLREYGEVLGILVIGNAEQVSWICSHEVVPLSATIREMLDALSR